MEVAFIAIIKFDFMRIVSPALSREYNVKFTQCLFCLIMMIIDTNGIQTKEKGIKRLNLNIVLYLSCYSCYFMLQVYVVFVKKARKIPQV